MSLHARSAVRAALARLLPDRRLTSPLDLNLAASQLGARDVLYGARTDGLTLWDERGATIHLALARSDGRRRATLAHECGHLVLDPLTYSDPFLNAPNEVQRRYVGPLAASLGNEITIALRNLDRELGHERLCDVIGNELTLPDELVGSAGEAWDGSISELREMSSKLRVSLSALTIALNGIGYRRTLLSFRRTASADWLAVRVAGAPSALRGRVTCPTFQSSGVLAGTWQGQATIEIVTGHVTVRTLASVYLTSERALVICETSKLDRQLGRPVSTNLTEGMSSTTGGSTRSCASPSHVVFEGG